MVVALLIVFSISDCEFVRITFPVQSAGAARGVCAVIRWQLHRDRKSLPEELGMLAEVIIDEHSHTLFRFGFQCHT